LFDTIEINFEQSNKLEQLIYIILFFLSSQFLAIDISIHTNNIQFNGLDSVILTTCID